MAIVALSASFYGSHLQPFTGEAVRFYNVSRNSALVCCTEFHGCLSRCIIPTSWVIDTYGIRTGVGIGQRSRESSSLVRGLVAAKLRRFCLPDRDCHRTTHILNAITTIAALVSDVEERATANGLASLAIYLRHFLISLNCSRLILYSILDFAGMLIAWGRICDCHA